MLRFVAKRLLSVIVITVVITFTSILLMHVAGIQAAPSEEPVSLWDTIRHVTSATGRYLWSLAHGDLGMSSTSGPPTPISTVVARTYPKSMALLLLALLLATAVGVPLGTMAAVKRHSRFSVGLISLSFLGVSAPSFFVAMLLQILLLKFYQGLTPKSPSSSPLGARVGPNTTPVTPFSPTPGTGVKPSSPFSNWIPWAVARATP